MRSNRLFLAEEKLKVPDKILLLPENIANQIAAGEVIQRPASAVKELLENAVDAGASEIKLILQEAGKALVQVIDNGCGMSDIDARMCFERHATSKIQTIEDLFHIRTMGFRGEALASIAAVAQVELKTKRTGDEAGTYLEIENSLVKKQEPVAVASGTSIAMKNLFFNVPARRNFLKSNAAEMRHVVDEFTRVALAFPHIFFSLTANGQQIFYLEPGNSKQRILQLMGNNYNAKLVPVKEETDYMHIYGFVGKPETAKKTRGDQYFFVNHRFIRSAYLNHAVMSAYQEMISADSFPMYALFIDLEPTQVDVNVHPTKQEIKFEDEKIVYAFVHAAIKHALAQFSITPALDFDLDSTIQQLPSIQQPFTEERQAAAASTSIFKGFTEKHQAHFIEPDQKAELKNWGDFIERRQSAVSNMPVESGHRSEHQKVTSDDQLSVLITHYSSLISVTQLHKQFILAETEEGFVLVNQQAAHERVLYEKLSETMQGKPIPAQRSMFPATIELTPADSVLLAELIPDLLMLGYEVESFGANTFIIQGTPADLGQGNEKMVIEKLLEQYKNFSAELKFSKREKLIRLLAKQQAIKPGQQLAQDEMESLINDLFHCAQSNSSPDGKPTYLEFRLEQLEKMFGR